MSSFIADLRYACRVLLKSPVFSATVILVLALGIGANSAVFSVVDAVLLRSLPYQQPDRLVMLWEKNATLGAAIGPRVPPSYSNFVEWQKRARSFSQIAGFEDANLNLTTGTEPERLAGARASANLFEVLGVQPALGRSFSFAADDPDRTRVVVLSDGFFKRHFAGEATAIGSTLMLNDIAYTVIGVLPKSFHLPASREGGDQRKPEVWIPYDAADNANPTEFNRRRMQVYGRLADGVTLEQGRAEMDAVSQQLSAENPAQNAGFGANVFPLTVEDIGPDLRRNLLVLLGAVGFVLLIACANLANLMLSRSLAREREMAIRTALGASRGRLIAQGFAESLLLSMAGAAVGLVVAHYALKGMVSLQPVGINRPEDIYLSGPVLLFTTIVSVLVALAFGIFPALQAARVDENAAMQPLGNRRTTAPSTRLRRSLITGEVALTCVLLVGATFMIKSFSAALRVDPGFRPDHLLTMKFSMPPSHYPNNESIGAFCRQVLDKVAAIPGVKSASFSDGLPLTRIRMTKFTVEGRPEPARGSEPTADMRGIFSPQYFDALGLRFITGRNFSAEEIDNRRSVIVINQALAQKLWPNESAVGQHVRSVPSKAQPEPIVSTIIGVVANTHQMSLEEATRPEITKPMVDLTQLTLAVRSESAPQTLVSAVKNQIWSVDRYLPVFEVQTMQEVMNSTLSQRRFNATVMTVFGSLALLLAAVGIYGVISSIAMQRTQEIGIRIALGAQRYDVLALILGQGIRQLLLGLVVGLAIGWMVSRSLASIFFGVTPTNMTTYFQVAILLTVIGLIASLLPALRAMRVSPVDALRQD